MRALAIVLTVLTTAFTGLWAYGYLYISAMACAFSNSSGCAMKMPWQLSGEDLQLMVLVPGAIFVALLGLTIWIWRKV